MYVLSHRVQPGVQRLAQVAVAQGCVGAAAFCVSADYDFLDLEMRHGVLDYRGGADVVGVHAVGDVAVHENFAGPVVADCGLRYATVGASLVDGVRRAFAQEEGCAWMRRYGLVEICLL